MNGLDDSAILGLVIYLALEVRNSTKAQVIIANYLEEKREELGETPEPGGRDALPYGWFDDGWPVRKVDEEERAPLENPTGWNAQDQFTNEMWLTEYRSIETARERIKFLRDLKRSGAWFAPEFLDEIFADSRPYVRAWAAGHLDLVRTDYSDDLKPIEVRNYMTALRSDSHAVVRAAVWSNPDCKELPWHVGGISKTWKAEFRKMSHLERLALMRNPELSKEYVVALLDTPSEELGITRDSHTDILRAAAVNPRMIGSSRRTGRQLWEAWGDPNPPFEEYGKMWELSFDKWLDMPRVPYFFFKFIQTTPETKLIVYRKLLEKGDDKQYGWLREEVIRSCDPIVDKEVLKAAWSDPREECRTVAKDRVGRFTKLVGVREK